MFNSAKDGYNKTYGGLGKHTANYELIYELWQQGKNISSIQEALKYDPYTISAGLAYYGVTSDEIRERSYVVQSKDVVMLDPDTNEPLRTFASLRDASNAIGVSHCVSIWRACHGKMKQAHGYSWRFMS